uniref:Uncharacterized protein n=1 Tax=Cannabis sativa TaxID=3483 RepID=A0A803P9K0_CANSA
MAQNKTLKELDAPNLDQQPLCIHYPPLDVNFELKFNLIHLLPAFHGLTSEDPNKHLKEFYIVCSSMKRTSITKEQIKLWAFPFSLEMLLRSRCTIYQLFYNQSPSQPEKNDKENASVVTLQSCKQYDPPIIPKQNTVPPKPQDYRPDDEREATKPNNPVPPKPTFVMPPPFLSRLKKTKKEEAGKEILKTLRKVEVNIPLLDDIKQVPQYSKFLKDLCTNKSKLRLMIK